MEKALSLEQILRRYDQAKNNARRYGIIDQKPLEAPQVRNRTSENFLAVVPNTKENIEKIMSYYIGYGRNFVMHGRGPRSANIRNSNKNFYGSYNGNYKMKDNPPYVAIYFKP